MNHCATIFALFFLAGTAFGDPCRILRSDGSIADKADDALAWVLTSASTCPENVLQLDAEFARRGLQTASHMVANRGRLNPAFGSFSFFDVVRGQTQSGLAGEIFIGHFTELNDGVIELDQSPSRGKLLIEAISFDERKGLYHFYELIGKGQRAQWFYRGDSLDALADNRNLHRTPATGEDKFGKRMRCSACHNSGGPIMKELAAPHNDWWTAELPLVFGPNRLSPSVSARMSRLLGADDLAQSVRAGMDKLSASESYREAKRARTLQEIVRPLFCTTEINLESSFARLVSSSGEFEIPSSFVVNPLLSSTSFRFTMDEYRRLLDHFDMRFPETIEKDADHIWLTPVLARTNLSDIEALINDNIVSRKVALDILMVDFTRPLFSEKRCALLAMVPNNETPDWINIFLNNLNESRSPEARELRGYLVQENSFAQIHEPKLAAYFDTLKTDAGFAQLFNQLLRVRNDAFTNEISKNPLGQILEPGFRVIFPTANIPLLRHSTQ